MRRLREQATLYSIVCLCLLMVVYKQLPEDDQSKIKFERKSSLSEISHREHENRQELEKYQAYLLLPGELRKLRNMVVDRLERVESKVDDNGHAVKLVKKHFDAKIMLNQSEQNLETIVNNDDVMYQTHKRVWNKLNPEEIWKIYEREKISELRYGLKTLDVNTDRQLLMSLFPEPNESRDRISDQLQVKLKNITKKKLIYVKKSTVNNQRKFEEDKCNVDQCIITHDIRKAAIADAVYVEGRMLQKFIKKKRNKDQVTLLFQLESAQNYPSISPSGLNWTATYRVDSVLNAPYGKFTSFLNVTELPTKPKQNYAKGKTKMAVWFVSNCGAVSGRSNFVKELQKYISVDVYGGCGKMKCSKNDKRCFEKLNTDYKFYLAFENSICKDYYTEKLFRNGFM